MFVVFFFFQAEDGIRDLTVTGVQTCALPICSRCHMPESDLVKTGIKGLDEILFGGIPRGNIILLAGTAGTGKTTLGVEFVYRGARQFNEPGVIVLFEVAPDKLIRDAALFGWDLRELERDGRLKMVFTTRQVFQQELLQADSVLLAEAAEIGARRIFVDGLVRLAEPHR